MTTSNKSIKSIAYACFCILFLSGCAATTGQLTPDSSIKELPQGAYVLGTGDQIEITVYGQEQISGNYIVDSNGNIALPLIQSISAKGLTIPELQSNIRDELSPKYLKDPKVSIQVLKYRDIYILGEVRNPGKFSYVPNMTLVQAIAVAGGHTYRAQEDKAEITRETSEGVQTFMAPAKTFVEPGDTIIVKRRWF